MIGAIIGDIIGSRFEFNNSKTADFPLFDSECRFTDDTVSTIATMDWLLRLKEDRNADYASILSGWIGRYRDAGFSPNTLYWALSSERKNGKSYGNGAAMRVSPVAWIATNEGSASVLARSIAEVTHGHKDGVNGANAIADCILMSRLGYGKKDIEPFVAKKYGYDLSRSVREHIQKEFDPKAIVTVPASIVCFLQSKNFESAVRNAISIGGDSDTIASMTAAIADAYYGTPPSIERKAKRFLPDEFKDVIERFESSVKKEWSDFVSYYGNIGEVIKARKAARE